MMKAIGTGFYPFRKHSTCAHPRWVSFIVSKTIDGRLAAILVDWRLDTLIARSGQGKRQFRPTRIAGFLLFPPVARLLQPHG